MSSGSLCSITVVDSRPDDSHQDYSSALEAARLDWDAMARRLEETRARVQATLDRVMNGRSQREAFDLLRRASQRANVKVSVLATQIVQQIASPQGNGDAGGAQSR